MEQEPAKKGAEQLGFGGLGTGGWRLEAGGPSGNALMHVIARRSD